MYFFVFRKEKREVHCFMRSSALMTAADREVWEKRESV